MLCIHCKIFLKPTTLFAFSQCYFLQLYLWQLFPMTLYMSSSSGLLSISSYESVCILICFNFNFVFFDGVFIKISLPLSFQFLSTFRVFQIVLGDGGISHWRGRGKGNGKFYWGGGEEFFIWWWEPEEEWFWPFEPFSLKLISTFYTFYKYWCIILKLLAHNMKIVI